MIRGESVLNPPVSLQSFCVSVCFLSGSWSLALVSLLVVPPVTPPAPPVSVPLSRCLKVASAVALVRCGRSWLLLLGCGCGSSCRYPDAIAPFWQGKRFLVIRWKFYLGDSELIFFLKNKGYGLELQREKFIGRSTAARVPVLLRQTGFLPRRFWDHECLPAAIVRLLPLT